MLSRRARARAPRAVSLSRRECRGKVCGGLRVPELCWEREVCMQAASV